MNKENGSGKRRVVLIQKETVQHYRVSVYNYLSRSFAERGWELVLIAEAIQKDNPFPVEFSFLRMRLRWTRLIPRIRSLNPQVVIAFLRLKDWAIWPVLLYGLLSRIPVVSWRHAVDLSQPKNMLKNRLYALVDMMARGILLYSEDEKRFIAPAHRGKVFVANNTLNFRDFPDVEEPKDVLKKRWNLRYEKIILFSGRIQKRKKLEDLVDIFLSAPFSRYGLVIVGPGMPDTLRRRIGGALNIRYLGPIYESRRISELFRLADVFCIPGSMGLSINQALFWGLPVVTTNVYHGPEICYLEDGRNGFIVADRGELEEKLRLLLQDDDLRDMFSRNARRIILQKGDIDVMVNGFIDTVRALSGELPSEIRYADDGASL